MLNNPHTRTQAKHRDAYGTYIWYTIITLAGLYRWYDTFSIFYCIAGINALQFSNLVRYFHVDYHGAIA